MRLNRILPVALLAGSWGLAGCGEDGQGPEGIAAFAGVWTAGTIQYTAHADPSRRLDITDFGGALVLTIDSEGDFTGTFTLPGEDPIPITGSVTLVGSNQADIKFNWPAEVTTPPIQDFRATYTLDGNTLTFTREETVFHFPGQNEPEAASLVIIMTR